MSDELKYWLAFSLVPGIGTKRLLFLREQFGDLGRAWHATDAALNALPLGQQTTTTLLEARRKIDPAAEMRRVEAAGAHLLTLRDPSYPALLKEMDDAPALLYIRGDLTPADDLALSVVGTRKATKYGRDAAFYLAKQIAQQQVTIISGFAHGIDSAAHQGALRVGGRTIAVLGCGVDVIYPNDHHDLAQQIIRNGALISEMPIGARPLAANFPRRNRILSGLALGVLVVEAPERSGSLITAGLAAEQGREVFAVPANIFNPTGRGTNQLIQDGAKLVIDAEDILQELNLAYQHVQTTTQTQQIMPENDAEANILKHLSTDPIHIDEIIRLSGLPTADVSSTLTILEMKGVAQMVGHMQYCLICSY